MILFEQDSYGYHTFRIPSLFRTGRGTLLAFAEGRVSSQEDYGAIHVVSRRSTDGGETWGAPRLVLSQGLCTIGNPCVAEDSRGALHLLGNWNAAGETEADIRSGKGQPRRVWHMTSYNDGVSWTNPTDITEQVRRDGWTWYACGPCHGVTLPGGRMVIPCDHASLQPRVNAQTDLSAHVIYSDDNGISWHASPDIGVETNECALAALPDGRLYINLRSYLGHGCRQVAWAENGGVAFSQPVEDRALVEPVCQGSVLYAHGGLYFLNPALPDARAMLTLKKSKDGGLTWPEQRMIFPGPSAYSDLQAGEDCLYLLYEAGEEDPYESIRFESVPLE